MTILRIMCLKTFLEKGRTFYKPKCTFNSLFFYNVYACYKLIRHSLNVYNSPVIYLFYYL